MTLAERLKGLLHRNHNCRSDRTETAPSQGVWAISWSYMVHERTFWSSFETNWHYCDSHKHFYVIHLWETSYFSDHRYKFTCLHGSTESSKLSRPDASFSNWQSRTCWGPQIAAVARMLCLRGAVDFASHRCNAVYDLLHFDIFHRQALIPDGHALPSYAIY